MRASRRFPIRLTAILGLCMTFAAANASGQEKILYTFTGGSDGELPVSGLIWDKSGNLYGTTAGGGSQNCQGNGCGTIFQLAPSSSGWTKNVLYSFKGRADGWQPLATLLSDSAGNLYGVTSNGGGNTACTYSLGCGTVFVLRRNGDGTWTQKTLYSFAGGSDGQNPTASLIFDKNGNLYGTTVYGGIPSCFANIGCGTVFEISASAGKWTETILYRFTGGDDGEGPRAGLMLGSDGTFFGTTEVGGGTDCYSRGCGTIFSLTSSPSGWSESVLYRFTGTTDGAFPESGLIQDQAGQLYGTTSEGGNMICTVPGGLGGCGAVFQLSFLEGSWKETVLYGFPDEPAGTVPVSGLTFHKGHLYGTTFQGGITSCFNAAGCGTVYELTPSSGGGWSETVLHAFTSRNTAGTGRSDGEYPEFGTLAMDAAGNLYGTTNNGGDYEFGDIFELTP
jgi:uncharacterized repeat protein (TIGR03803 family)